MRTQARTCTCKSDACVRRHEPAHTVRVSETYEYKFSALKTEVWNESHIVWSRSKPSFFNYINPYMIYFKNIEKIIREKLRFIRNNESKREFFIKHLQVNFILIRTFSSLDSRVLKFTNYFCLVVNRLTEGNGQNQA